MIPTIHPILCLLLWLEKVNAYSKSSGTEMTQLVVFIALLNHCLIGRLFDYWVDWLIDRFLFSHTVHSNEKWTSFAESLDELSDIVVRLFRDVPNKQVKVPHWTEVPFKEEHLRMQLKVVPVSDIRSLSIIWTIPDLFPFYKTKVCSFLYSFFMQKIFADESWVQKLNVVYSGLCLFSLAL